MSPAAAPERQRVRSPTTLEAVRSELATRHLRRFIREAWHVVEPATTYQHNWHIDAICEHLEAVTRFEIPKLIINVPPRHMKSLAVSVFWPAWVWVSEPHRKFLYASYAATLSTKHSVLTRRLIDSRWYQDRYGDRFNLATDANLKTRFENDESGFRLATSVGGVATGEGGDYLVIDDPHNVNEAESDAKRDGVAEWWDGAMSTRINNPLEAARVLIMQRVHETDLTGHLTEQGDWTVLCLPAEYEPKHPFVYPDDPRSDEGEVLWPDRWGADWLAEKRRELGSYRYAGQYQQRPAAAEGGILQKRWWGSYEPYRWPQIAELIASWDCAFKDLDDSDFVVGQLWGRDGAAKYLLAQIRARLDLPGTLDAVAALSEWAIEQGFGTHAKLVEDKANGSAVIQVLRREIPGLIAVEPQGGKEARAHAAAPEVEAGNVYLPVGAIPCPADPEERWGPTPTDAFIEEAGSFPRGAHDDQVDAFSQAIIRYGGRGRKKRRRVRTGGYDSGRMADR